MSELLPCPVCSERAFIVRMERLELAYFGDILQLGYTCQACGFRRADFHVVHEHEPVRYEVRVGEPDDLSIRVVRSGSGHFEVPELGIRATPSEAAEAFVTNTEGILDRCQSAVETARHGAATPDEQAKADELLARIGRLRAVEEPWTLVLEDALGNSAIASDKATRKVLTAEQAEALGHPYVILDAEDLRAGGAGLPPGVSLDDVEDLSDLPAADDPFDGGETDQGKDEGSAGKEEGA